MFEKHKSDKPTSVTENPITPSAPRTVNTAVIGSTVTIKGDISGEENLIIAGKVTGNVTFASHEVTISNDGCVNADVTANVVKVEGEVKGDLSGNEKVVISKTGKVQGNIVAPRVTLEDGAKFKGSIDMDPGNIAPVGLSAVKSAPEKPENDISKPTAVKNG